MNNENWNWISVGNAFASEGQSVLLYMMSVLICFLTPALKLHTDFALFDLPFQLRIPHLKLTTSHLSPGLLEIAELPSVLELRKR